MKIKGFVVKQMVDEYFFVAGWYCKIAAKIPNILIKKPTLDAILLEHSVRVGRRVPSQQNVHVGIGVVVYFMGNEST